MAIRGAGAKRLKSGGAKARNPGIRSAINKAFIMQGRQKIYNKYAYPIDMVFVGFDELIAQVDGVKYFLENDASDMLVNAAVAGANDALSIGFSKQIGRDGKKWPPISPKTIEYRSARGYQSQALLIRGGALNEAVNQFGLVYQKAYQNSKAGKTFQPVNMPIEARFKTRKRQKPETVQLQINKSSTKGSKHLRKDVTLTVTGPGVINNFGTSFTGASGRQIVVPARPFWYIDNRVLGVSRRHVYAALDGVNSSVASLVKPPPRSSLSQRAKNKFISNYAQAKSGSEFAGMSKAERLKFIAEEVTRRRKELKGDSPGKLMSRERARQKRGSNPWEYLDSFGRVGMRDVSGALMHASGTHVTQQYRRGPDSGKGNSFEDIGKLIIGVDLWGNKKLRFKFSDFGSTDEPGMGIFDFKKLLKETLDEYDKWKESGSIGSFRGKNGNIKLRAGVQEEDIAYLRSLHDAISKRTIGKNSTTIKGVDRFVLINELWAIQKKSVQNERTGGLFRKDTGRRVAYRKASRHELASYMQTDPYGDILFSNLHTAARINPHTNQVEFSIIPIKGEGAASLARRRQRVAELNAAAKNNALGHTFGTTAVDLYMLARGRLEDLKARYEKQAAIEGLGEIKRGETIRGVYHPSTEELAIIYAPFGTTVVPHQMKVPEGASPEQILRSMYRTTDSEARQRTVRYNLAHQVAQAFGAQVNTPSYNIVQKLIADYFGHTDLSVSNSYLRHVGERGYHSSISTTQIPLTINSEFTTGQALRAQFIATRRAMDMMSRMMGEAWAEAQIRDQENILKQAIRGYNRDAALELGQKGIDDFQSAVNSLKEFNRQRDAILLARAQENGFDGKHVYGPNYFTTWREGGWSPNIQDMNEILFGNLVGLTERPMQPQQDRLMRRIGDVGHKGRKTNITILDDFELVTRRSANWFENGYVGVEDDIAARVGLTTDADVSPQYKNILAFHREGFKAHDDKTLINESTGVTIPVSAASRIEKTNEVKVVGGTWWRAARDDKSFGYSNSVRKVNGVDVYFMAPGRTIYGEVAEARARSQAGRITFEIIRQMEIDQPELFSGINHVELYNVLQGAVRSAESFARIERNHKSLTRIRQNYFKFRSDILSDTVWAKQWSNRRGNTATTSKTIIERWLMQNMGLTLIELRAGIQYFLNAEGINSGQQSDFSEDISHDEGNQ